MAYRSAFQSLKIAFHRNIRASCRKPLAKIRKMVYHIDTKRKLKPENHLSRKDGQPHL